MDYFQDGVSPNGLYSGTRDTTIVSGSIAGGTTPTLTAMKTGIVPVKVILLRWDMTYLSTSSSVRSATITLSGQVSCNGIPPPTVSFFAVSRGWTELGADWTTTDGGAPWQTPGAAGALDRGALIASARCAMGSSFFFLSDAGVAL